MTVLRIDKLRTLRKEKRLTQTEVAKAIGKNKSDLSRIERSQQRITAEELHKLSIFFGVDYGYFFENEVSKNETKQTC